MGRVKGDSNAQAKFEEKKEEKKEPESEPKEEEKAEEEDSPAIKELKEIDDKYLALEREYEKEVQKLLVEYTKRQQPLLEERKKVLTAETEDGPKTGTPALAGFWLKAMSNHPAFEDCIQEYDEPVLQFLADIEKHQDETDNMKGFKLVFNFLENPYFENTQLTKEYVTEEGNPYCGEVDVKEIKSSTIEWKAGKNVTVEKIAKKVKGGGAKKQKAKGKEKEEARPSFFREFFRTLHPEMKLPDDAKEQARSLCDEEDDDDDDDENLVEYLMASDHEVGTALRDNIIPFAVRWYTGEAAPDYERMEDDDDEDEESEEDDDDDEDSEDERPKGRGKGGAKAAAKKAGKAKGSPPTKPGDPPKEECKQQ